MSTWQQKRDAIAAAIKGLTGTRVVWSDQDRQEPARPYARMGLVSGPVAIAEMDEVRDIFSAVGADIEVAPVVVPSGVYTVTLNGTAHTHTAGGSPTAATIIAALVALVNAGAQASALTATDNLDGTMRVQSDDADDTFTIALTANLSYTNNDAGHEVERKVCGIRQMVLQVSVVTDDIKPPNDAVSIVGLAYNGLRLPSILAALSAAGIAIHERMPVLRIPEISGSQRVDRATFDVRMSFAENVSERTGYIETIEVEGAVTEGDRETEIDPATYGE